jgi:hypothetical protein
MRFGAMIVAPAMTCVKLILDPLLSLGTRLLAQNGGSWEYLLVAVSAGAMSHINLVGQFVRGIDHAFLFSLLQTGIAISTLGGLLHRCDSPRWLSVTNRRTNEYPSAASYNGFL